MKKKKHKKKKGFTLIELLAVIIILGILMIIAIPSVTEYISSSRKNAYVITAKEYVTSVVNKVNALDYNFMDDDTTYYVPISCIPLEKGGASPFGEWRDAYVIVTYDGVEGHTYYWTSLDSSGYKVEITNVNELDVDSLVPSSYALDNKIGIEGRKWISIVDENTCEIGTTIEAQSNFGNQRLANVVSIGDFVNYDAGVWDRTVAKPTSGFNFGGYTQGASRNNSINCGSERNMYNGWRVLEVEGEIVTLIHAGSSECYYQPNGTDYGCIGRYLLTGDKNPKFGYCTNPSVFEGYDVHNFNVYMNDFASSASSLYFSRDNIATLGDRIEYENAEAFAQANPEYNYVVNNSYFDDCTKFYSGSYTDVFENGAKGHYWLGFGANNKLYYNIDSFSCYLPNKGVYMYISSLAETTSISKGVRPVITLKARVKTSGQVEQVVGTNGTTKAMVWQLVK